MPKRLVVLLPDRINALIEARMKKRERLQITPQILSYIKIGEFVYDTLDRDEKICVKKPDGTIHEILFVDP